MSSARASPLSPAFTSASSEFWSASDPGSLNSPCNRASCQASHEVATAADQPDLLSFEVLSPSDENSSASLATPKFSDNSPNTTGGSRAEQEDCSQQPVTEYFDSTVDVVKQLDFDPVPSDLQSLSSASSPQDAHAEAAVQRQAYDNGIGGSNSEDLLDIGAQASAKPSYRRRAALDSDSDIDEIWQQRMDSKNTAASPQLANTPPSPAAYHHRAYDFGTFSSDGSDHSAASSVLKQKQRSKSKRKKSRQHSESVIELTSSDDDSRLSSDEDSEDTQKENASPNELASHLKQLQIARSKTAFKPMKPFLQLVPPIRPQSLLPKPKMKLQFSAPPTDSKPLSGPAFKRQRDHLVADMFQELNAAVFQSRLPADLEITWNAHLTTTAGMCYYWREKPRPTAKRKYMSKLELSSRILDDSFKLQRTLSHELCHAAAWLLDHTANPPHGPRFKAWAAAVMKVYPHLDIAVTHEYDVHKAWRWQCINEECQHMYYRHSNSINVETAICALCRGGLQALGRFNKDGTPAKVRAPNQYSLFVKDNFAMQKAECGPGTPHKQIMQALSARWQASRAAAPPACDQKHDAVSGRLSPARSPKR